jgi:hypothetical protein
MAAPYNPPVKGEDLVFYVYLEDAANPGSFKVNPTIAAGDFKVKKDGGAPTNLTTLPAVDNVAERGVKITLSSTEVNADNVMLECVDQTSPKEWNDLCINIPTTQ